MLKFELVRTKMGRQALCFHCWNGATNEMEDKLVYFDEIDQHLVLTDRLDRVDQHLTSVTFGTANTK